MSDGWDKFWGTPQTAEDRAGEAFIAAMEYEGDDDKVRSQLWKASEAADRVWHSK